MPPLQGTFKINVDAFKINVDAAFNQLSRDAAVGVVIRDCMGSLKLTVWRILKL